MNEPIESFFKVQFFTVDYENIPNKNDYLGNFSKTQIGYQNCTADRFGGQQSDKIVALGITKANWHCISDFNTSLRGQLGSMSRSELRMSI